ncbi:MAG: DUF6370 family protein [Bryocella sp.]
MKLITTILALGLATAAFGEDVKIEGEAQCGKCALHKSEKCHTVIVTKDANGKELVYWLVDSDKDQDKAIHSEICKSSKGITAWGEAGAKSDGTKTLKVSKYEFKK